MRATRPTRSSPPPGGLPELFSIHRGRVARVQPFGAFVSLEGYRRDGLVHISQLAARRVESCSEVVRPGQEVWVKVVKLQRQGDQMKIGLSMSVVAQTHGTDMDPTHAEHKD